MERHPANVTLRAMDEATDPRVDVSRDRRWIAVLRYELWPGERPRRFRQMAGAEMDTLCWGPYEPGVPARRLTLHNLHDDTDWTVPIPVGTVVHPFGFSGDSVYFGFVGDSEEGPRVFYVDCEKRACRTIDAMFPNRTSLAMDCPMASWLGSYPVVLCRSAIREGEASALSSPDRSVPVALESGGSDRTETWRPGALLGATDRAAFVRHFTAQLTRADVPSGRIRPIGSPTLLGDVEPSPDGRYLLIYRSTDSLPKMLTLAALFRRVEVWDSFGNECVRTLAHETEGRIGGARRPWRWHPIEPATLVSVTRNDAETTRIDRLPAPFQTDLVPAPDDLQACVGWSWTTEGKILYWRKDRSGRVLRLIAHRPGESDGETALWEGPLSEDFWLLRHDEPIGDEVRPIRECGLCPEVAFERDDQIYVTGHAIIENRRQPFLDQVDIRTGSRTRVFQSRRDRCEIVVRVLDDFGQCLLVQEEGCDERPRYCVLEGATGRRRHLDEDTEAPSLVSRYPRLVCDYSDYDGQSVSAVVYHPERYEDDPLPFLLWIYPQQRGSFYPISTSISTLNEYVRPKGAASLKSTGYIAPFCFLQHGYGVVNMPPMPVVRSTDGEDRSLQQIVYGAEAVAQTLVDRGIADRGRIALAGHCFGATAVATILANSDLFCAGICLSGVFNYTVWSPDDPPRNTRFLWEAPAIHLERSPLFFANRIRHPVLLIHAEHESAEHSIDYARETQRFYSALEATGCTARYVCVPDTGHFYESRAAALCLIDEMVAWCRRFV